MKTIQLTQNKQAIVSDEDYDNLAQYKWCYQRDTGYAVRNIYPVDGNHPVKLYMHRVIMKTPADKSIVTDHINRDRLDNQRSNLRIVSRFDNLKNSFYYEAVSA